MKKSLILLMCMNMLSGMGYSIVAPLFPSLSKDFSLGESLMGCIISIYAIANTLITPLIPSLCKYFSRIKLLYLATFFEASCTFICVFRINRFILRIIHGIGSAFVGTLIYSVACSSANEDELKPFLGYID